MKKLYVIVKNCGDGSYSTEYTFDEALIHKMKDDYDEGNLPEGYGDGDGFHYDTLNVPDECTYESLGIRYPLTEEDIKGY